MEPCPIIPRKITKKKTFTYLQYYSVLVPWYPGTVPVACKKRKVGLNGWVVKRLVSDRALLFQKCFILLFEAFASFRS